MKKNKFLRLASLMLMLCLITTCAISGTFAKYTTSVTSTDAAKVAKWGVSFNIGTQLAGEYTRTASLPTGVTMQYTVKAGTGKVVAPGTSGDAYTFTATGEPEVSYKATFALNESTSKVIFLNKVVNNSSDVYRPVALTVKMDGSPVGAAVYTVADLAAIIGKIDFYYDVSAGKYFYTTDNSALTPSYTDNGTDVPVLEVEWSWTFNVDATADGFDTVLGDLAAGLSVGEYTTDDYCLDFDLDITATATQVD